MEPHPADLTIAALGTRLREGTLGAVALLEAHLERIARRDGRVRAFVALDVERAHAAAARADTELAGGTDRGPLHGIPFAVKDVFDMAGLPTSAGSYRDAERIAGSDADAVSALLRAGAVPLGKLATYEHALDGPSTDGPHPPPRNPWNGERITGGSSSGSAAAVAAGLVRFALGTDTGGSVRSPAAYCGVVGLKPTFGALSTAGVAPLAPGLDHVGIVAASAEEARLAFAALRGEGAKDFTGSVRAGASAPDLGGVRIGYARAWFADDDALEPGVLRAIDDVASTLSLLGARIELAALPAYAPLEASGAAWLAAEAFEVHRASIEAGERALEGTVETEQESGGPGRTDVSGARDDVSRAERARRAARYGRWAWAALLAGRDTTEQDRERGRAAGRAFGAALDRLLRRHDALLTACTLTVAPRLEAFGADRPVWTPMRTLPFDLSGHPAIACPAGLVDGMPVGLQLAGRAGAEEFLCGVATAIEHASTPLGRPRLTPRA